MSHQISDVGIGSLGWAGRSELHLSQAYQGAGPEIRVISKVAEIVELYRDRPQNVVAPLGRTLGERRRLQEDFREIETDCAKDNWDGEGASKIKKMTVKNAHKFLELFPAFLPLPDVAPEPDGHINLGWFVDSTFLIEISVDAKGCLFYAGRFGETKFRGRGDLTAGIPGDIIGLLGRFKNKTLSD